MRASEALALGALDAGVAFVTGYPGSPSTAVVEALLRLADEQVHIEWATNERSAFDAAFGASVGGMRSLVCLKSVGLNVALDSLMVSNLAGGDGGFVVLVGDDPGAWSSQNEQDSRLLVAAAEVPLLEPTVAQECRAMMVAAFALSEQVRTPVVVRITAALAASETAPVPTAAMAPVSPPPFRRQPGRWVVLPASVVAYHRALHRALDAVREDFEVSPFNGIEGAGRRGVIAAGFAYGKLAPLLKEADEPPLRVLRLGTPNPLPERRIEGFLHSLDSVLVLEEMAPFVETQVGAIAQRVGLSLPILGRASGHVPEEGELSDADIVSALAALFPGWPWPPAQAVGRPMPSREPLCQDCPYILTFRALLAAMEPYGGREAFLVTGEPGCMVRAQLPPFELFDLKYAMGSSIGLAAGLARATTGKRVVALAGDSALLHTGLAELIDATLAGVRLLVVLLANQTTALSGGQAHAASGYDTRGRQRRPLDLAALVRAAGAAQVRVVDPQDEQATQMAFEEAMSRDGLAVVIATRACPRYGP